MTTMAPKHHNDADRIKTISEKFLENEELTGLIDELAGSTNNADDLVKGLLQASLNRGLTAELDAHLGYAKGDRATRTESGATNSRNGAYPKTIDTTYGPIDITVPRDRDGTFSPQMVPKGARRLGGLDEQIISLYAGGMTIRDIQHHLSTTLGTDLSHETISQITDAVLDEVMIWQKRQLESFYPVIYLDAIRIKVRDNHRVIGKSAYLAVGVDLDGIKHVLGIWIQATEGAAFWAHVCADLANRGVEDVLIVCCDGLKGLPEAVEATWPDSMVQTCVVHLIRAANRFVVYADRKQVSRELKAIYTATDEDTAWEALQTFADGELGKKYPQAVATWVNAWDRFIPFLQFPPMVRKVIYTTNSIESLNNEVRKATRNRVQFSNDESAIKTLWLTICNIEDKRAAKRAKKEKGVAKQPESGRLVEGKKTANWKQALNQLIVAYPARFEPYL